MSIMADMKDLVWRDNETGTLNKVKEFHNYGDIKVVFYVDLEYLDLHCMDVDMFILKHKAMGVFDDIEESN